MAVCALGRQSREQCHGALRDFSNSTAARRYYGKNVHMRVPPASTTKVMTALLVLEKLPLIRS